MFDLEKIEKKGDALKLSNAFIEGIFKGKLEVADKKLLNLVAHKILSDDKHSPEVSFDISEVVDIGATDSKNVYRDVLAMLNRLLDLKFIYANEEEEECIGFGVGEIEYKKKRLRFHLLPAMQKVFLSLDKGYTRYLLENIKPLRSIYAIRMYELLRQYAGVGWRKFEIDELRKIFNCENKYLLYKHFRNHVLKRAQKELAEKTDIIFEFKEHRRRWKIWKIEFFITDKNSPAKPRQENLPGELDQMRLDVERFELELRRVGWSGKDFNAFISGCGGYEVCKRFWDDLLKADIERQVKRNKLENPGAVIRRGMEQAKKYQPALLEKKTSDKGLDLAAFRARIAALSDAELVELVKSKGTRAVQSYGAAAEEIRDEIDLMPGVAMCELS